ncbi:MAG: thiol-disulfide oxidoreductase DCC family protein [Halobacteria archaeon]
MSLTNESSATLVYDDDCGFCKWWAEIYRKHSSIDVLGFSEISPKLEELLPDDYENCSHVVTEDRIYSCGASMEEAFVRSSFGKPFRPIIKFLRTFKLYNLFRAKAYRFVADHRDTAGKFLSK